MNYPKCLKLSLARIVGGWSAPIAPVEAAVLDGFGDVFGGNSSGAGEVGDGAGDLEDAVVGAGAEAQAADGATRGCGDGPYRTRLVYAENAPD